MSSDLVPEDVRDRLSRWATSAAAVVFVVVAVVRAAPGSFLIGAFGCALLFISWRTRWQPRMSDAMVVATYVLIAVVGLALYLLTS